jgi:serine/threonine protein kinase
MSASSRLVRRTSRITNPRIEEDPDENLPITSGNNTYQIGNEIGKGGFAIVYKALNVTLGINVALKRFPLRKIDKESLQNIESEIELMQKLNHPNIVNYMETIKTNAFLYIVLELMEDGSLAHIVKSFGPFTEAPTAVFITQVLRGLQYLHDQGVLHRDIKGANILINKGVVKLADFGVAMKLSDNQSDDQYVVGSPYWIAPEIINMASPTSACDIWSLGCTAIELLTGKPPYFHLNTAQALFRIVQDDYPPIPEGISQALRDFLLNCFQKEPAMRSSAAILLEHPWLQVSTSTAVSESIERVASMGHINFGIAAVSTAVIESDVVMNTIRMHQRDLIGFGGLPPAGGSMSIDNIAVKSRPVSITVASTSIGSDEKRSASPRSSFTNALSPKQVQALSSSSSTGHDTTPQNNQFFSSRDKLDNHDAFLKRGLIKADSDIPPLTPDHPPVFSSSSMWVSKEEPEEKLHPASNRKPFDAPVSHQKPRKFFAHSLDNLSEDSPDDQWDTDFMEDNFSDSNDSKGEKDDPRDSTPVHISKQPSEERSTPAIRPHISRSSSSSAQTIANQAHPGKFARLHPASGEPSPSNMKGLRGATLFSPQSNISLNKYREDDEESGFNDFFDEEEPTLTAPTLTAPPAVINKTTGKTFISSDKPAPSASIMQTITVSSTAKVVAAVTLERFRESSDDTFNRNDELPQLPLVAKQRVNRTTTKAQLSMSATISSSGDLSDDWILDDSKEDNFAKKLREKLASTVTKQSIDDDVDEFLNYQFDEKDFKQNEQKDIDFRRSREVVDLLSSIRPQLPEEKLAAIANQIIQLFEHYPEQRDHLITYYGVMPIVDMFEGRPSKISDNSTVSGVAFKSFASYVLRITNKIIESSIRTQEQLSLVGIIPTIMSMFEKSSNVSLTPSRSIIPFHDQASSESINQNSLTANNGHANADNVTYEAARFIHQISLSSALTLQMLIGAGGLGVLTSMVSYGGKVAVNVPIEEHYVDFDPNSNSRIPSTPFSTSKLRSRMDKTPLSDDDTSDDDDIGSAEPMRTVSFFQLPVANGKEPKKVEEVGDSDDEKDGAWKNMEVFKMGINCIAKVFAVQSSRTRDFCRLFVKLGLLPHLASSFQNMMLLFRHQYLAHGVLPSSHSNENLKKALQKSQQETTPYSQKSGFGAEFSLSQGNPGRKFNLDSPLARSFIDTTASSYLDVLNLDSSIEGTYALAIASLLFKFSCSDSVVKETMASIDTGLISVILYVLRAPELHAADSISLLSPQMTSTNNMAALSNANLAASAVSSSAGSSGPFGTLSAKNLNQHNATTVSMPTTPQQLLRRSKSELSILYGRITELVLKSLDRLSQEPSTLEELENAGALEVLVPLLRGPLSDQCKNSILPCIYNMCRINRRRQDLAAALGIVPSLKKVVLDKSPMKEFALPILLDFAHTSNSTRKELWKNDGVTFFVDLLEGHSQYWQAIALNSIAAWLTNDTAQVGQVLVQPHCLNKLIRFFKDSSTSMLQNLHKPLLDMISKSSELAAALSSSSLYITSLVRKLTSTKEAIVIRSLLRILQLLHANNPSQRDFVLGNDLLPTVRKFAQTENQVLVFQSANRLLMDLQKSAA